MASKDVEQPCYTVQRRACVEIVSLPSIPAKPAAAASQTRQRENVVAAIMGHAKDVGITFNLYSSAELFELIASKR
jgi:hypothetical protein